MPQHSEVYPFGTFPTRELTFVPARRFPLRGPLQREWENGGVLAPEAARERIYFLLTLSAARTEARFELSLGEGLAFSRHPSLKAPPGGCPGVCPPRCEGARRTCPPHRGPPAGSRCRLAALEDCEGPRIVAATLVGLGQDDGRSDAYEGLSSYSSFAWGSTAFRVAITVSQKSGANPGSDRLSNALTRQRRSSGSGGASPMWRA